MTVGDFARRWLPPVLVDRLRTWKASFSREWEYVPEGWPSKNAESQGWNDQSVAATQLAKWPKYLQRIQPPAPLTVSHENPDPSREDAGTHHLLMTFGYVLALAAQGKKRLSVLDWGSGLGHYYALSRAMAPELQFDYHCKDVRLLCEAGRSVLPEVTFHEDEESCFARSYDLILVSGSLQYSQDWKGMTRRFRDASQGYLYITRTPFVQHAASFTVVQRPHRFGYQTEYMGWFLNRAEFLGHLRSLDMELLREFLVEERPVVHRAPEQGEYRGFLFRRAGGPA